MTWAAPRRRFGQNFLHDPRIIARILALIAPRPDERLVEIGPGRGALTRGLLAAAGTLDAIELDRELIAPLERLCAALGTLHIHQADALVCDYRALAGERGGPLRLVGNLPYNISTPLLFRFLEQSDCLVDLHLMLQREVVERLVAAPGGKTYGRLSVMVQTHCTVTRLLVLGPGAFQPAPQVESALVRLVPRGLASEPLPDPVWHARLVATAFAQRRKTLRNSLGGMVGVTTLEQLGIDPGARAETLSVADFARLASATRPPD